VSSLSVSPQAHAAAAPATTAQKPSSVHHAPYTPTLLTTSPATTCRGDVTAVGDGDITLYATVSDPDGDQVAATFTAAKASTGAVIATGTTVALSSGSTAVFTIRRTDLEGAAGGAITKILWKVRATDYTYTSDWSTTCRFKFDPTRPGTPSIIDPGGETIASPATFTIVPPTTGTPPASYTYQLNGGPPVPVAVVKRQATMFTLTPNRLFNTLTVTALSAGGNVGGSASLTFGAAAAPTAVDSDLNGDGIADLLAVGGVNDLPSGLWLAKGQSSAAHPKGDGQVTTPATDIGVNGSGQGSPGAPADFDGSQAITGHFTGGTLQDVLIYFASGNNTGGGAVLHGTGNGSPLLTQQSGNVSLITAGTFTDGNGDNPLQLANAGNTSHRNLAYPDLIAVNGDPTTGYYLDYYPNSDLNPATGNYEFPAQLATPTPDGTMDWNTWTITTAQTATGTAMFLWNTSTHALYLWSNPTYDYGTGIFTPGTQYLISSSWNPGAGAHLQAADINGDGTPDLWAITKGPTATAYLIGNLSTTAPATVTAQPAQTLTVTQP
jgi:hypothetical protein